MPRRLISGLRSSRKKERMVDKIIFAHRDQDDSMFFRIGIHPEDIAQKIVDADSEQQAEFFLGFADSVESLKFKWDMQCSYIAREMGMAGREAIIKSLTTLIEQLEES